MVKHINFAVDDDLADDAKAIKKYNDLSWERFTAEAIELYIQAGMAPPDLREEEQ